MRFLCDAPHQQLSSIKPSAVFSGLSTLNA